MDGASTESVAEFAGMVGCDEETARFFLEANAGNVERALEMFREQMQVQQHQATPQSGAPTAPSAAQPAHRAPASDPGPRPPAPIQPRRSLLGRLARAPLGLLRATVTLAVRTLGLGFGFASFLGHRLLPAPIIRALTRSAEAVTRSGEIVEPTAAAAAFVAKFREVYGEAAPDWQECSWQEAAARAHRQFKFLFVYIHSPQHPNTAPFCRSTLCAPELLEFLGEQVVPWGGDVRFSDAYSLANSLKATTFPFVALLLGSSSRLRLAYTHGGPIGAAELRDGLQAAIGEHGAELVVERAEAQEREFNRRLREEQDREYQESLEQDRLREEALAEKRRAEEEEAREAAEEEARIRAEAEAEERRKEEFQLALQRRREKALAMVLEEPELVEPGACPVRVRMPNGTNKQRRFLSSNKVQAIYDYLDTDEEFGILRYNLVSNFPHCVYDDAKRGLTIGEAGLAGAMLLVQTLDE
mmetsp:Transcript_12237/g.31309  ORF Transcript_12237/g.31309 Transcript_12237/m.31309 type:complete len:471 (+) Transcript_12237:188-1600(+)